MRRTRLLGRPSKVEVDPTTGTVVAHFQDGGTRTYTRDEIAEYVVDLAGLMVRGEEAVVPEAWFEFLTGIVGKENMAKAIEMARFVDTLAPPPGLVVKTSPA